MKSFNPDNLFIEFRNGVTEYWPIYNRKYTLTHSDRTAELFLNIGMEYAYDKINILRDEVLAEWKDYDGYPYLHVYVYVNGQSDTLLSDKRHEIFRRELPLALQAIYYGDRKFLDYYFYLKKAPIWVYYDSQVPGYSVFENWGIMEDYRNADVD